MTEFEENIKGQTEEDAANGVEDTTNDISRKEKIRGWLIFFLICIGIGSAITVISGFMNLSLSDYDTGLGTWVAVTGACCDGILLAGMGFLGFYAIISFITYRPDAVGLAKAYIVLVFATNLISVLSGDFEETGINSLRRTIMHLLGGFIWFLYLCFSKQINTLFPRKERKMYKRDKILLFSVITPVTLWLIFVFSLSFYHFDKFKINENILSANEYTDGKIIFKCPCKMTVERKSYDNETYFYLTKDDQIAITLCSVFDTDDTREYFEECMQSWRDESMDGFEYDVIDETHRRVADGNSLYKKTLQYHFEPVIEWMFVMIFNEETYKCCVVSCYSAAGTDCPSELINSIRFKN
jgi:hypothetical protein